MMLRFQPLRYSLLWVGVLFAATAAAEAARLQPPSVSLTGQENIVVVATAVERTEDQRILFKRRQTLHGESAKKIQVRMDEQTLTEVELGRTYILGYTLLQRLPQFYAPDPQGARLVMVPAVGEALLEDTPELRWLLRARGRPQEPEGRDVLEVILAQIQSPDVPSRHFVLAELVLRPDLLNSLKEQDLEILRTTLESDQLDPLSNDYLLRALRPLGGRQDTTWLADGCRTVLESNPAELDLASFAPALVKVAAEILGDWGQPEDIPLLSRHLYSNNPGVGKAALKAMVALDPVQTRAQAEKALELGDLQPDVRQAVQQFLSTPRTTDNLDSAFD